MQPEMKLLPIFTIFVSLYGVAEELMVSSLGRLEP